MGWGVLSELYVAVKSLPRYKGTLFWIIVFPLLFYGLEIAIWGNPQPEPIKLGALNLDGGVNTTNGTLNLGSKLIDAMNQSGVFHVYKYGSLDRLREAVRLGKVSAGIVIPENFTRNITNMTPATVQIIALRTPWGSYHEQVTRSFIKAFSDQVRNRTINVSLTYIEQASSNSSGQGGSWLASHLSFIERFYGFLRQPIRAPVEEITPPLLATEGGLRAYYALGLIGIETIFIGLSMGIFALIDMKREGTLKILLSSPLSSNEILASLTLSALFFVAVSSLAVYLFSLLLGAEYDMSLGTALASIVLLAIGALSTIGFGLLLAPLARSQEAATAILNSIAFPVMFLGGFTIPTFALPGWAQEFARVYPLSRSIEALRQMLTYGKSPLWALEYSSSAILATIVVYALGALVYNRLIARALEG